MNSYSPPTSYVTIGHYLKEPFQETKPSLPTHLYPTKMEKEPITSYQSLQLSNSNGTYSTIENTYSSICTNQLNLFRGPPNLFIFS